MSARAAVQQILVADLTEGGPLGVLGFTSSYGSNSVDTPEDKMFIICRWEEQDRSFARHGPQRLTIWVHTRDLDYTDLDKALERVKDLLEAAVQVRGADGWVLTQADWRGDSVDLIDDGFKTLTRYAGFDVVSRYHPQ